MKSIRNFFTWYFSKKALPYWSILLIDCICVIVAGALAYLCNHGTFAIYSNTYSLLAFWGIAVICFIIGFRIFHTYSGIIRYSSFSDLIRISLAVLVGLGLLSLFEGLTHFGSSSSKIEPVDIVMMALLVIAFMWLIRIWVKTLHDDTLAYARTTPIFIYGIKQGGVAIAKSINAMENAPFKIVGFTSNDRDVLNKHLMGHKVYPFTPSLINAMRKEGATAIMVSPLMMESLQNDEQMQNAIIDGEIKILVMPNAREWDRKSDIDVAQMREVTPEELLPREKIEIDMKAAADMITGKRILITGGAGSIGSEIVRQIASYNPEQIIIVDQAETPMHDIRLMMKNCWPEVNARTIVSDIADQAVMERVFKTFMPQYVFHAAAYKHVPMMEDNPYEAVINNVKGTRIIADLAVKYGTKKFVMVSTDKAVNPTNVMGCSKRICEIYVQSLDAAIREGKIEGVTRFVTTRFGNVLGSNGSVIPIFQEQIKKGGPVTVTHPDIIRFFMLIPEACKLVIEAGTMGKGGEIFVFDMGKPVRIADLATRMIKLSGAKNIEIKFTGLRDGEKLYEEVLNDEEKTLPTFHPKIKIAQVRLYEYSSVTDEIDSLILNAYKETDMQTVARMKKIVPEFKSQHSKYEQLDK